MRIFRCPKAQLATFNNSVITARVPDTSVEDLAAFYRAALTAQGWLVTTDTVTPTSGLLAARQDPLTVEIRFSPTADGALDLIIMPGK